MGLITPDLQVRFLPPPLCGSFSGKTPGRDPGITGSIPVPQSSGISSVGRVTGFHPVGRGSRPLYRSLV